MAPRPSTNSSRWRSRPSSSTRSRSSANGPISIRCSRTISARIPPPPDPACGFPPLTRDCFEPQNRRSARSCVDNDNDGAGDMKTPFYKILYVQVLFAIVIGVLLGQVDPGLAQKMKPLGDGFVALIRMVIAPIIFCTVVARIAGLPRMKRVGRGGGRG